MFFRKTGEKFRDNFLEILNELIDELSNYSKERIKKEAEYVYELLSLCRGIRQFEKKDILYEIADEGILKGILANELDLHQVLLSTLASYHVAGDHEFWIGQMYDESNKYYANAAFYALLSRGYRLDILFDHIGVFIDRFKGEINLELGIRALINDHGKDEIVGRFKGIEAQLSREQKKAVNNAFIEAGFNAVYTLDKVKKNNPDYTAVSSFLQKVSMPTPEYGTAAPLERKTIEAFKSLGFDVETKRVIAGHAIDIFIKKKKTFKNRYECGLCFCVPYVPGDRKVGKRKVEYLYPVMEAVLREFKKETHEYLYDDCQLIIISEKGFTKGADEFARKHDIVLETPDGLISQLEERKD